MYFFRRLQFLHSPCYYLEGIKYVFSECFSLVRTVGHCAQTWLLWRLTWIYLALPCCWQARLPSLLLCERRGNCSLSYLFQESGSVNVRVERERCLCTWHNFKLQHSCVQLVRSVIIRYRLINQFEVHSIYIGTWANDFIDGFKNWATSLKQIVDDSELATAYISALKQQNILFATYTFNIWYGAIG